MSERAGQPTSYRYSPGWRLFTRIVLHPLLRLLMKNRWAGKENIPATGGIILARTTCRTPTGARSPCSATPTRIGIRYS